MKYFFDTEFIDNGGSELYLVSIGIVREDGAQYYVEVEGAPLDKGDDFFQKEVRPHLKGGEFVTPYEEIAAELKLFVGKDSPEFWAWFVSWDWFLLTRTFGTLVKIPRHWAQYAMDAKQLAVELKVPRLPDALWHGLVQHNALDDAEWCRRAHDYLQQERKLQLKNLVEMTRCCCPHSIEMNF